MNIYKDMSKVFILILHPSLLCWRRIRRWSGTGENRSVWILWKEGLEQWGSPRILEKLGWWLTLKTLVLRPQFLSGSHFLLPRFQRYKTIGTKTDSSLRHTTPQMTKKVIFVWCDFFQLETVRNLAKVPQLGARNPEWCVDFGFTIKNFATFANYSDDWQRGSNSVFERWEGWGGCMFYPQTVLLFAGLSSSYRPPFFAYAILTSRRKMNGRRSAASRPLLNRLLSSPKAEPLRSIRRGELPGPRGSVSKVCHLPVRTKRETYSPSSVMSTGRSWPPHLSARAQISVTSLGSETTVRARAIKWGVYLGWRSFTLGIIGREFLPNKQPRHSFLACFFGNLECGFSYHHRKPSYMGFTKIVPPLNYRITTRG